MSPDSPENKCPECRDTKKSESRVDSCQWPTSGIGVALRRSDDWPFSTGPQAIGLISGFYTQVEVVPASLARELEAELRVATDETQTEAKPESLKEEPSAAVPVGDGVTVNATDLLAVLDAGLPFGSRAYMPIVEARDRLRAALNGEGTE